MSETLQFSNHPPLNISNAEEVAVASRDGGCYRDIGFNTYKVLKGKRLHLVHRYNSGCDSGGGTHTESTHLGSFETDEELIAHLLKQREDSDCGGGVPWWVNRLLSDLWPGYRGEEA